MGTKNIHELNLDDFTRIQGPDKGSDRDGSRVVIGRAGDRSSCVKLVDGKLHVSGTDEFRRTVEDAYAAKQAPSAGFGYAPNPTPVLEPEPTLSRLMPITDTTKATLVKLPILVYESATKPGKNADGSTAEDMKFGEWSVDQIRSIKTMGSREFVRDDLSATSANDHFATWRNMTTAIFSSGEMKMVLLAMIHKVQKREGGEFRHPLLNKSVRSHPKTQAFANNILDGVNQIIIDMKSDINSLVLRDWYDGYKSPPKLFAFNNRLSISQDTGIESDVLTGLTMAINSIWSGKAEITKFERSGGFYKGNVRITFYDHFGLDLPDVGPDKDTGIIKPYGLLPGFRSWFILQHLDTLGYKPFITVVELDYPIQGEWH